MDTYISSIKSSNERAKIVSEFLVFLSSAQDYLKNNLAAKNDQAVKVICEPVEEHYIDDQNKPAMYQRFLKARSTMVLPNWQLFGGFCQSTINRIFAFIIRCWKSKLKGCQRIAILAKSLIVPHWESSRLSSVRSRSGCLSSKTLLAKT